MYETPSICIFKIVYYSLSVHRPQEFSQRSVGWQLLPAQIFTASDVPLKHIDFSHNSMRRLAERLFDGGFPAPDHF